MSEKRMLILDVEVARKIDENRGNLGASEFINFLIDSQLNKDNSGSVNNHVTKEEFSQFEHGIKELLRNFMEFFISYGLELGRQPTDKEFEALSQKLQAMGKGQSR